MSLVGSTSLQDLFFPTALSGPGCCYWFQFRDISYAAWYRALVAVEEDSLGIKDKEASLWLTLCELAAGSPLHQWLYQHFDKGRFAVFLMGSDRSLPCKLVAAPIDQVKAKIKKELPSLPYPLKEFFQRVLNFSHAQCQLLVDTLCRKDSRFFDCMLEFFPEEGRIIETEMQPEKRVVKSSLSINWKKYLPSLETWHRKMKVAQAFHEAGAIAEKLEQEFSRKDPSPWDADRSLRTPFVPALTQIVTDVLNESVTQGAILELGSYRLNNQGLSVCSSMASKEMQERWIYSDLVKEIVRQAQKNRARTRDYLFVDALKLGSLKERNIQTLVYLNVLDTLRIEEIEIAAHKAFAALPQGGRIIVLTEQAPVLGPRVNPLLDKGLLVSFMGTPGGSDDEPKTMIAASKEVVVENICKAFPKMPSSMRSFFEKFFALSPSGLRFLIKLFSQESYQFFDCLNHFFPQKEVMHLDPLTTYFSQVQAILAQNGFTILKAEKRQAVTSAVKVDQHSECIYDMGTIRFSSKSSDPQPSVGWTKYTAHMHVIVAIKP